MIAEGMPVVDSVVDHGPEYRNGLGGLRTYSTIITPEKARLWLAESAYERQRPISRTMVDFLADALRRGEFKSGTLEFRIFGSRRFQIDGQHRLAAIVAAGISAPMVVVEQTVGSVDEVHRDYARTDRGRGRSFAEIFRAYDLTGEIGLTKTDINLLSAAANLIDRGFRPRSPMAYGARSSDARVRQVQGWADEMRRYTAAVTGAQKTLGKSMRIAACAAIGLVTLREQPEKARLFWHAVAMNDGLRRGDPMQMLVTYLMERATDRGYRDHLQARYVARCWNAYFKGETLGILKVLDPNTPIVILGTSYDGKQAGGGK